MPLLGDAHTDTVLVSTLLLRICTRLYTCPTSSVESGTTTTTTTTLRMHIVSTILFAQSRAVGPGGTDAYSGGRPTVYLTPAVGYASHPCYAHLERVGRAFYDSYFRDSPESQRHIYDDQDAPTAVVAAPSGPTDLLLACSAAMCAEHRGAAQSGRRRKRELPKTRARPASGRACGAWPGLNFASSRHPTNAQRGTHTSH